MDLLLNVARKATVAAAVAGVGTLGAALADGDVTAAEGVVALGAALVAWAATFSATNE